MLYLSLEMVSITSYVMVAYMKGDRMSNEASLKYVLFGAVSTGAMLYGLSLLYGMAGTTSLPGIRAFLGRGLAPQNVFAAYAVAILVFAGFGFKTAVVPFHFWCPDVYQGAPTPVTAFLSVAPKAAGFAVMTRFFFQGMSTQGGGPVGPRGVARLAAPPDADLRRHDDRGEHRGAHPDEHEAPAGLFVHRPRGLHHDGRRGPVGERRPGRYRSTFSPTSS